jgi:hypothetical protein
MDLFNDINHEHIIIYNTSFKPEVLSELIDFLIKYSKFKPNEIQEIINSSINISPYNLIKIFNFIMSIKFFYNSFSNTN